MDLTLSLFPAGKHSREKLRGPGRGLLPTGAGGGQEKGAAPACPSRRPGRALPGEPGLEHRAAGAQQ